MNVLRALELRIPPLAVVLGFAAAMAMVAAATPAALTIPGRRVIGVAFAIAGVAVAVAGVVAFRRHMTTVSPFDPGRTTSLVTTGVYRFTRNPMYLGFLLVLAGWAVYLADGIAALLLPLFVAYMTAFQVMPEERALSQRFGHAFIVYASQVRRWL